MNLDALKYCESEEELTGEAGRIAESLGFEYWVYLAKVHNTSRYQADWSIHNLPEDLLQAYAECNLHTNDPISDRSRNELTPRSWVLDPELLKNASPHDKAGRLHLAALKWGLSGGLCVPVHDVDGSVGTLTLATCEPVTLGALDAAQSFCLLFSKYLHEACRRCLPQARRPLGPHLSPREIECLDWAAKGKTTWEISRVLAISEHTVIYHFRNASAKLGATSRQQAIVKSIRLGMLAN